MQLGACYSIKSCLDGAHAADCCSFARQACVQDLLCKHHGLIKCSAKACMLSNLTGL